MNKLFRRTLNVIAIVVMLLAMSMVAYAEGTTTIGVSKNNPAIGDSITVTVKATESGTVTVKYTSSLLKYSSCSVSGATASGNTVSFSGKEGNIVFETAASGTASIIVSSTSCAGSSATLPIGASAPAEEPKQQETKQQEPKQQETKQQEPPKEEATPPAEPEQEPQEDIATTSIPIATGNAVGTLREDGKFDIDGATYVASERYSANEIPAGFTKQTITIGDSSYAEPSNGSITLVYLKLEDNTNSAGVFYVFDQAAGTISPFYMLGDAKKYIIISGSSEAPGTGFVAATLEVTGGNAPAYTMDGSEFFYINGVNQDGVTGWFVYDKTYNTVSRVDISALTTGPASGEITDSGEAKKNNSEKYIAKLNLYRKIIMGLIVLSVILIFIVINGAAKRRGDDDGDIFAKAPTKSDENSPRSIVFKGRLDEPISKSVSGDKASAFGVESVEDDHNSRDTSRASIEADSYVARRDSSLHMMDLNDL